MPTPDDLADVIARYRKPLICRTIRGDVFVNGDDLAAILDAAEAGMRARDAALEEAAAIADNKSREGCACHCVGAAIRARTAAALRAIAQGMGDD